MSTYNPTYANSYALIIGIDSYADPRLVPLGNAESDARTLTDLLSTPPYDFHASLLLGEQATKQAIQSALFQLRGAGPDDRILVYFAGHGYTLTNKRGYETGYLACADTLPEQDFTALELAEVTRLRDHTDAKHIAFIFDACFSGQALGMTRAISEGYLERRAYQVLSAGAGDQTVSDYRSMTRLLVDALGAAPREVLSLNALGLHIQSVMRAESRGRQVPQVGHLTGSQGGDFVFRWPKTGEYPAAAPPVRAPIPSSRPDTVESVKVARPEAQRRKAPRANTIWIGAGILGGIIALGSIGAVVVSGWLRGGPGEALQESTTTPTEEVGVESTNAGSAVPSVVQTEALATPSGLEAVTSNDEWIPVIQEFDGVPMALVPVGCFQMGSSGDESDERPVHEVCFEAPYWIDVTEVINRQFTSMGGTAEKASTWSDADAPRESINWREASAFCEKRGGRLPTEAEWEYAARGPDALVYPWGDQLVRANAVMDGLRTATVGSIPANRSWIGAFDLAGNVWEWVADWYGFYSSDLAVNPQGPASGEYRILRGGGWNSGAWSEPRVHASEREWVTEGASNPYYGFRCARDFEAGATATEELGGDPVTAPTTAPTPASTTIPVGFETVTRNADWTPVVQEFDGVSMALVPVGCFQMGSNDGKSDEQPVHEVCFEEPFWIDVYEVTNGQIGEASSMCSYYSSRSDQPHVCVTSYAAIDYCASREARLPTEAEWEYAARGPDSLVYPWGDTFVEANVVWNVSEPAAVGSHPKGVSWVGALDMSGNVFEWVADWYLSSYYSSLPASVIDPQGPSPNNTRGIRGGSWLNSSASDLRSASRDVVLARGNSFGIGIRCVRDF